MKQVLVIVMLLSLIQNEVYAQTMVQEGNRWNIAVFPTFSPNTSSYAIVIGEDTIVNNIAYNKVYYTDSLNINRTYRDQLLRQDSTKKVFIKENDNDEYLLYDFNLNVNDTFVVDLFCTLTVTDIDTVLLNNSSTRKRLKMEILGNQNWGTQYWVDGIGSDFGMLNHFGFCYTDYSDRLLCFYNNDELLFPESPPSCFITPIEEIIDNEIEIYPNPASYKLIIENTTHQLTRYRIYSIAGDAIQSGHLNSNSNNINIANLQQGIYTILLGDEKEFKYSKKILKIQ